MIRNNNFLLLLIGFAISHIVTSIILAVYYSQAFTILSPFYLVQFYISQLLSFNPIFGSTNLWFWFYLIGATLPIGISELLSNNFKKGEYGYASFATSRKFIKKMGFNFKEGVVFGRLKNNLVKRLITGSKYDVIKSNEPLSTLMIAPTGTGKTAGFIIPTLQSITNSVVIFDIKGELYTKTHQKRKKLGQKILVLDPLDFKNTIKFNPFATNQLPERIFLTSYIGNISNVIFTKKGDGDKTDYFTNTTKDLFNTITLYLINKYGFTTITQIKSFLLDNEDIGHTLKIVKEELKEELDEDGSELDKKILRQILEGINKILQIVSAKDQFSGVIGSFNTKLSFFTDFDIENIVNCEKSTITANDLRKKKTTLYLKVKDIDLERLNPLLTLFFETLASDLVSNEPSKNDNQITFILDEFGNLGRIKKLVKITTISRSFKLNQIFVLQDLEQLSNIYSKEERNILEANTAYKIILKQNNFNTAKAICDLIGNRTELRTSENKSKKLKEQGSISKSWEGIPLVSTQDILNLEEGKCLILTQGYYAKVIKANIPWYFN